MTRWLTAPALAVSLLVAAPASASAVSKPTVVLAPAEGDTVQGLTGRAPGSLLGPETLETRTFPAPDGTLVPEGSIKTSAFRKVFAADLPKRARPKETTQVILAAAKR